MIHFIKNGHEIARYQNNKKRILGKNEVGEEML